MRGSLRLLVRGNRGQDRDFRARAAERRLQLGAHPLAYPFLRGIARIGPVVRVPRVGVVVSDAALARAVLTDTAAFTKTGPGSPAALWTPVVGPSVLLNMEGDEHAALRRALADLFAPRAVAQLCERAAGSPPAGLGDGLRGDLHRELSGELGDGPRVGLRGELRDDLRGELRDDLRGELRDDLGDDLRRALHDGLAAGAAVDLVPVAQRLAGSVIAELVGLDPRTAAGPAFAAATAVTSMVRLARPSLTHRQVARGRAALATLTAPAATAYREGDPETVPGRMRALGLTEREALGAVAAFALTGTETVVSFIPRLVALLLDSGWLSRLATEPDRVDDVLAEALRVTVPSPVMLRGVAAPTRIGGVEVQPGDRVVIATVSAARALGAGFDPDRPHPPALRHLWFGAGPHFCLGMPLAMAQARLVLDAVLAAHRTRPLRVVRRRVARRVLIPAYRELVVARA